MRTWWVLTLSLFVLHGCKSQKVIAVETEIAAAKSRVAALEKKRQELTAESKRLQIERKTFSQQADEAALAKERLYAASFALANLPLPDGVLLDEALRSKSPKLGALAATIVQRQLPCLDPDAETENDEYAGPDCSPPPLEDSCAGVAERNTQAFGWVCQSLPASGKVPSAALCVSNAEVEEQFYPLDAPTPYLGGDVVRLAFEKKGRLVVADWPPPSVDVYTPRNWAELATCSAENDNAQCIRHCDERWGRLNGCDDYADGYEGEGGDEDSEPAELRAARIAAAEAERQAQEARDELSYQECLAPCGTAESEPESVSHLSLEFTRSPAPGLYQFDVQLEQEDGGSPAHTLVISFPALHDELAGTVEDAPEEDTVNDLVTVLDVEKVIEGKVADGQRVLAGFTLAGLPVGARISMDGKAAPVALSLDEVCTFGDETKNKAMNERCVVAKAQRDEALAKAEAARLAAAAKAAARDGGLDAGVDAGVKVAATADAGVTP